MDVPSLEGRTFVVRIPSAARRKDTKGLSRTYYKVITTHTNQRGIESKGSVVFKRYSDFTKLRETLIDKYSNIPTLNLPPKHFFSNDAVVLERCSRIERAMNDVLSRLQAMPTELTLFLNIKNMSKLVDDAKNPSSKSAEIDDVAQKISHCLSKRPPDSSGRPTEVFVNYFLLDIPEISAAENYFIGDFYLDLHWNDLRLKGKEADDMDWTQCWSPGIEFPNARDVEKDFENWLVEKDSGRVTYQTRIRARFSSTMTLRKFPFDAQKLEMQFESGAHTSDELILSLLKTSGSHALKSIVRDGLAEWRVGKITSTSELHTLEFDGSQYSTFKIVVNVERRAGFYVWKIVLPFSFIVLMSFSAYFMDPAEIGDRVGTSIEAALTATAFQVVVNDSLPKVGYLTYLDLFLMTAFAAICIACAESVYVYLETKKDDYEATTVAFVDAVALRMSVSVLVASFSVFLLQWR
eukprot:g947.t1